MIASGTFTGLSHPKTCWQKSRHLFQSAAEATALVGGIFIPVADISRCGPVLMVRSVLQVLHPVRLYVYALTAPPRTVEKLYYLAQVVLRPIGYT
eukprot:2196400-Prymnesium_polylepis.1